VSEVLYCFIHVPKTGGATVKRQLARHEARVPILYIYPHLPDYIVPGLMSNDAFRHISIVYGHFRYGIHQDRGREYRYLTILRDPYDFLLSHYFFSKEVHRNPAVVQCSSVFEMLETNAVPILDNLFVRMIYGSSIAAHEPVQQRHLEQALATIDRDFAFVGLQERLPESLAKISNLLGLDLASDLGRENVTPVTEERRLLDIAAFRVAAARHVRFDLLLYAHAQSRFWGIGPGC
jgi:hypothetical protein